jgi:hypothetical protein
MSNKNKACEEVNVQKDLKNQVKNDMTDIELFIKNSKH